MAITPTRDEAPGHTYLTTWANLVTADPNGESIELPGASDRTVQVTAAVTGGATVVIEGSLQKTPTKWFVLKDTFGDPLSFTAEGGAAVNENIRHIRARLSVPGSGADWTVYVLSRSTVR